MFVRSLIFENCEKNFKASNIHLERTLKPFNVKVRRQDNK